MKAPAKVNLWMIATGVLLITTLAFAALFFTHRNAGEPIGKYRFTPFAVSSEPEGDPMWSPDGKAAAYLREVEGDDQLFVRYLNSQMPVQLTTAGAHKIFGWSPDSRRIFFLAANHAKSDAKLGLFSISAVGGDPNFLMAIDSLITAAISPDGNAFAIYKEDRDGFRRIYTSSPLGAPFKPYPSDKFATKFQANRPKLRFSPDGKKMLLLENDGIEKRWLLPYPPGKEQPRQVLTSLWQSSTPDFAWFPDSRHIVLSIPAQLGDPGNLWVADTSGNDLRRITSTTTNQNFPAVSPDGRRLLYQESRFDLDIAKVTLTDGKIIRLIATERDESMPAWAGRTGKFAYVTNRTGQHEVWVHNEDGSDRPLVTAADFAPAVVNGFMDPTLTPEGDRVLYTLLEEGKFQMYISSASGGAAIRVTNSNASAEFPGALSPDGKQLTYLEITDNKANLMIVKTNGQATPSQIRADVSGSLPQWSNAGDWISFQDHSGWRLISPDGKNVRNLGDLGEIGSLAFSLDGKKLYGIRHEKEHQYLFSMEVSGGPARTIADLGKDYQPSSDFNPGYRLSIAPDGTCAIYSIATTKGSLWLFEGFRP